MYFFSCGLSRKFLYGFPCIKEVFIVRSLSFPFGRFIENVTENSFYFYTYNFVININPFLVITKLLEKWEFGGRWETFF